MYGIGSLHLNVIDLFYTVYVAKSAQQVPERQKLGLNCNKQVSNRNFKIKL